MLAAAVSHDPSHRHLTGGAFEGLTGRGGATADSTEEGSYPLSSGHSCLQIYFNFSPVWVQFLSSSTSVLVQLSQGLVQFYVWSRFSPVLGQFMSRFVTVLGQFESRFGPVLVQF